MKKTKKKKTRSPQPVRTLDEPALSDVGGGTETDPPPPYIGHQHNETLVRDRRRRARR